MCFSSTVFSLILKITPSEVHTLCPCCGSIKKHLLFKFSRILNSQVAHWHVNMGQLTQKVFGSLNRNVVYKMAETSPQSLSTATTIGHHVNYSCAVGMKNV